ncbi:MAG: pilus assembly protein PilM [Candidatus Omnitrophica bacterium]|jgi:hypothetical protein|nr:pilus assembly protein PilM [Candidatus Omnitrophota bacterium]
MKEKKVGIYLGTNSIGAVSVLGKKIIASAKFDLSSLQEVKEEALSEEIRWEALVNKTLREVEAGTKDIYISFSDRDFIFRLLDMPLMRKRDIQSSLIYEVGKYIPFKMEELAWDYKYVSSLKEKKVRLSFVGIRERNLARAKEMLSRLELNAIVMEPSCLSLVRAIKLIKNFTKFKNFALLDLSKSETYLTFFQYDLPVFNRYLALSDNANVFNSGEFIESINFSLQYFKREFKNYKIDRLLVIEESKSQDLVNSLKEVMHTEVDIMSPSDLTGRNDVTIENVKAFGASAVDISPYKFKPNLRKSEEYLVSTEGLPREVSLKRGLLGGLVLIGAVICMFIVGVLGNEVSEQKFVLKKKEEKITIPEELKEYSWSKMVEVTDAQGEKIKSLKAAIDSLSKLYYFFRKVGEQEALPKGVWFEEINISKNPNNKHSGMLRGYIFLDDNTQEDSALNELVSLLRQYKEVNSVFENIDLETSEKRDIRGFKVTYFALKLN